VFKPLSVAGIGLAIVRALQTASARYPSQTAVTAPFYRPAAGPQTGGKPYQGPGFTIYPPGSPAAPRTPTGQAARLYPPGAQTCVAAPYTCRAEAPNTVGDPCACPTRDGGFVPGTVH
jgi:hypothetical protein